MGFLSKLFGSNKALDVADNAVNRVAGGLDQLFYTKEEKTQDQLKLIDFWIETQKVVANESTTRSITRRFIALAITFNFLALINTAAVLFIIDRADLADRIVILLGLLDTAFAGVLIFYFSYYGATKIIDHIRGKKES